MIYTALEKMESKVPTTLGIGKNDRGFTLIEVLLSIAMFSIALVIVLGGYNRMLEAYRKARLESEGSGLLQEKIIERELEIKAGFSFAGESQGEENQWKWKTSVRPLETEKLYELEGTVEEVQGPHKISAKTYVRHEQKMP